VYECVCVCELSVYVSVCVRACVSFSIQKVQPLIFRSPFRSVRSKYKDSPCFYLL
jgi:hypothetical protein